MLTRTTIKAAGRTTIDLPRDLLKAADAAVKRGAARSRNALVTRALTSYLRELEEREIDAQIAEMANDHEYHALMEQICAEFAQSDWEAFQLAEPPGATCPIHDEPMKDRSNHATRRRISRAA